MAPELPWYRRWAPRDKYAPCVCVWVKRSMYDRKAAPGNIIHGTIFSYYCTFDPGEEYVFPE